MLSYLLNLLHNIFDKTGKLLNDLVGAFADTFDKFIETKNQHDNQRYLNTATGEWLDKFGKDVALKKLLNETDESYRARIKAVYLGRGITRPKIKATVDSMITPQTCTIYKWDEYPEILTEYEFEIQLPIKTYDGFFTNQAYLNQNTFTIAWLSLKTLWDYKHIEETVNRIKPAGSIFKLTCGGEAYG